MTPDLHQQMLRAADDGDQPAMPALETILGRGRRIRRRRAVGKIASTGVLAAAVATPLFLVQGGPTLDGPAGTPVASESITLTQALAPLVTAMASAGLEVEASPEVSMVSAGTDDSLEAQGFRLHADEAEGTAIGTAFSDADAVTDMPLGEATDSFRTDEVEGYSYEEQCAVLPAYVHRSDFAWTDCQTSADGRQRVAVGGDEYGAAVGVTLIRPDGSGVSLAVSAAAYDRPVGGGAPTAEPLASLPLTADELLAVAQQVLEVGVVWQPPAPIVVPSPDQTTVVPPTSEPSSELPPPSTDPAGTASVEASQPGVRYARPGKDFVGLRGDLQRI